MGSSQLLHTKSSYGNFGFSFPGPKGENLLKVQRDSLLRKEQAYYHSFFSDCDDYDSFIKKLRDFFKERENDKKVFEAFKNCNIEKELEGAGFEIGVELPSEIVVTFDQTNAEVDIRELLKGIENIKIDGDKIIISTDLAAAKATFNKLFSQHFKVSGKSKRNFSWFLDKLNKISEETAIETRHHIKITGVEGNVKTASLKIKTDFNNPNSDAFSYKKEDIDSLDKETQQKIANALKKVKNFILNIAKKNSASPEMYDAIGYTWKYAFDDSRARAGFFEKGGFINYLKGAFGEFQVALMQNYLAIVTKNTNFTRGLISNTLGNTEQAKSDVTLLKMIGADIESFDINAQVKNINIYSTEKINGNIHLNNFSKSVDTTSFEGFLANYFFNTDYQHEHETAFHVLENCLEDYFAEIMNLAVSDALEDKVTFYYIGGGFLIPGSSILSKSFVKSYVEITSDYKGMSNEEYMSSSRPRGKKEDDYASQPFLRWWKPVGYHIFKERETNTISELFSHITIRTGFFHGGKDGLAQFSLF